MPYFLSMSKLHPSCLIWLFSLLFSEKYFIISTGFVLCSIDYLEMYFVIYKLMGQFSHIFIVLSSLISLWLKNIWEFRSLKYLSCFMAHHIVDSCKCSYGLKKNIYCIVGSTVPCISIRSFPSLQFRFCCILKLISDVSLKHHILG